MERPGATVSTLRDKLDIISDFKLNICVLQIASNDLCHRLQSPEDVAGAKLSLVEHIIKVYKVQKVIASQILFQILHRLLPSKRTQYDVDLDCYNSRVESTNRSLGEFFFNL